jgi:hypothetical protein
MGARDLGGPGEGTAMRYIRSNTTLRNRLPNRRNNETFELEVAGLHYTCTISRFPDGRCCEVEGE